MRISITAILKRLHEIHEKVEEYAQNAEGAENPDWTRVDKLTEEAGLIQSAIDELESIE